jgi:uncharacterized protein YcaQ
MTTVIQPATAPVTKNEIAAAVSRAFGAGAVHRDTIAAVARASGARHEVLELVYRVPAYRYQHLQQLLDAVQTARGAGR